MQIDGRNLQFGKQNAARSGNHGMEKSHEGKMQQKAGSVEKGTVETSGVDIHISRDGLELSQEKEDRELTLAKEREEKALAKAREEQMEALAKAREEEHLRQIGKEQAENSDKAAEAFKDMAKIMEIARRISNGDIVPALDEKKLMEFDADLYQMAKAAALINADKEHKKYDSLYEEKKDSDDREKLRGLERESADNVDMGAVEDSSSTEGTAAEAVL